MSEQGRTSNPKYLFVCTAELVENPPKLSVTPEELHKEHVAYLQDLFDKGILMGSGPREDPAKNKMGGAIMIFQNLQTTEEARAIAIQEPNIRDGLRTVSVSPWRRMWFGD